MFRISKILSVNTVYTSFEMFLEEDFVFSGERHNFWEFLYIIDGTMSVVVEDKVYELEAGNIIFYSPMEFHSIRSAKGTSPHIIIMSFSLSGSGFEKLAGGFFDVGKKEDRLIRSAYSDAAICMEFDDEIKKQLVANKLEELMLGLLETRIMLTSRKKTVGTENYRLIVNVMNENVEKNLSSEEIARLCGMSLSNMKKVFKKYSGVGIMKYYSNLRILKAMELIHSGKTMAETSELLNFSSQHYFTEAFKRQCGITPTEHKKRFLKPSDI
ncbi:MAG: helix-turn-helix transcriptional regulator [Clostridia bacterium]|nr:helix-turn-helix transcriptional regulator [Clostridia bacterium]